MYSTSKGYRSYNNTASPTDLNDDVQRLKTVRESGAAKLKTGMLEDVSRDRNTTTLTTTLPSAASDKPFSCKTCRRAYTRVEHLRRHVDQKHDDNKRHSCEHCGKRFARSDVLRKHDALHLREASDRTEHDDTARPVSQRFQTGASVNDAKLQMHRPQAAEAKSPFCSFRVTSSPSAGHSPLTPETDVTATDAEGAHSLLTLGRQFSSPTRAAVVITPSAVPMQLKCRYSEETMVEIYAALPSVTVSHTQEFIQAYFSSVHPTFPILHEATWNESSKTAALILAVACLGARSLRQESVAVAIFNRAFQSMRSSEIPNVLSIEDHQSQMLMRIFCLGDVRHPIHQLIQSSELCEWLSQEALHDSVQSEHQKWLSWIRQQSYRRLVVAYIYLLDFQTTLLGADQVFLQRALLDHLLPDDEHQWNAETSALWATSSKSPGQSFLQTLDMLCLAKYAYAEIQQLHPFTALAIPYLQRMLAYHQRLDGRSALVSTQSQPLYASMPEHCRDDSNYQSLKLATSLGCLLREILTSLPPDILRSCISAYDGTCHIGRARFLFWLASKTSGERHAALQSATNLWRCIFVCNKAKLYMPILALSIFYAYAVINLYSETMLLCHHLKGTPDGDEHLYDGRNGLVLLSDQGVATSLSLALGEEVNPDRGPTHASLLKLRERGIAMLESLREDTAAYALLLFAH